MMTFERIKTEYYTVPKTNHLEQLLLQYKKINNTCCSLNERQLLLYIINRAIDENVELFSGEVSFESKQNIKVKKTRMIKAHFDSISQEYAKYGARISQRQYFYRLTLGYLTVKLELVY
ncbi:hypothetical protein PQE20_17895 [Vibrio harveyi]|uniref:hypothetical protein n=1 Tax=Vibrio harveyi TaxID=669 RepID=UPI00234C860F|nr:hypothetical protein [Vibrio harveyi]WCP83292.1 hypothetical protein PQE20_17895 [Vibrio harveyi]